MALTTDDGDRLMARLIEARDGAAEDDVEPFLARLILLLANEIGDLTILYEAIDAARATSANRLTQATVTDDQGSVGAEDT